MHAEQLSRSLTRVAVILGFALSLCGSVPAQVTYKTLYKFKNTPDGNGPFSGLVADFSGNLYGTTLWGGASGNGTVFELSPASGGKWTESVLYSFTGGADGANPQGGVTFDSSGNLYGTAQGGGLYNEGVVFQLTPANGGWTQSVIYNFTGGADGATPNCAHLIFDNAGNLYGTAWSGGSAGYGVVYELSPGPNNTWTQAVLHTFQDPPDLENSASTLIFDSAGNLYGTCFAGGKTGNGGVYELVHGSGGWTEKILYQFKGGTGGGNPAAGVIFDSAGNLYGITGDWMSSTSVVYELMPKSGGGWTEHSLRRFPGCSGSIYENSGLTLDEAGNLYGASLCGGPYGDGFIFKMTSNGSGGWSFQRLHAFDGKPGGGPSGNVMIDTAGNIYGPTLGNNSGTVFEISP